MRFSFEPGDGSLTVYDLCPRCGETLECDEVDVGVGIIRGNWGCPACHWVPADDSPPLANGDEQ